MKALLVLDMIDVYIYGLKPLINLRSRKRFISNVKLAINIARSRGVPVIFVNSLFRKNDAIMKIIGHRPQAIAGGKDIGIIKDLNPHKEDFILIKRGFDGFWQSNLYAVLKKLRIKDIYLTGQQTDCCIRETASTAAHLGYNVFVLEDCCSTINSLRQKNALGFIKACAGKIITLEKF